MQIRWMAQEDSIAVKWEPINKWCWRRESPVLFTMSEP